MGNSIFSGASLRRDRTWRTVAVILASAALSVGCHSDTAVIPAAATDPYSALLLDARTVVMSTAAPFDTLQLHVHALTASGATVTSFSAPTYTVYDTALTVTATGLLKAKSVTSSGYVVVSVRDTIQNITHADTAFVVVTSETNPPTLASFSLHTAPGDSAKIAIADMVIVTTKPLFITATGTAGEDLSLTVPVRFFSSDSSVATVDPNLGFVKGMQIGHTIITASTTWYGVTKSSALEMVIGNPVYFQWQTRVSPSRTVAGQSDMKYEPTNFTIGVGGIVSFNPPIDLTMQGKIMDVIFDDSTNIGRAPYPDSIVGIPSGTGNVAVQVPTLAPGDTSLNSFFFACYPSLVTGLPPFINLCATTRYFPIAGRYTWHSRIWGLSGTITVQQP